MKNIVCILLIGSCFHSLSLAENLISIGCNADIKGSDFIYKNEKVSLYTVIVSVDPEISKERERKLKANNQWGIKSTGDFYLIPDTNNPLACIVTLKTSATENSFAELSASGILVEDSNPIKLEYKATKSIQVALPEPQ